MAGLNLSGAARPLFADDDKLRFVKEFAYGLALDKLGLARHRRLADQPDDVLFVYGSVLPALVKAIEADDPEWLPDDAWLRGEREPTSARGTAAVRWFVEIQELQKATYELSPDLRTGATYDRLYKQNGSASCFLDDLRRALMRGDPEWRGPWTEVHVPLPE